MSVIEFTPRQRVHRIDKKPDEYPRCEHTHLLYDARRRTVSCKDCEDNIEPFDAVVLIAQKMWWEKNRNEMQLERDEKQVSKVQRAAIENLHAHGVTPEIYAERWAQQDELVKAKVASIEERNKNVLPMESAGDQSA